MAAREDKLRGGRFEVLGLIGEGAQGRTFGGVDRRDGRAVAIKRFDVRGASSWKDVELAEREARVLKSVSHPSLPAYVDHFEEEGALYLVMEKIEGDSLAALKERGERLGEEGVWRLLRDAAGALDYLHRRAPPLIHRDLKPGNVIRRPDGSFCFVDFGAVRDRLRPKGGSTVVGTFGYMAPEQVQGRALPASDVYAIAATALSMLTGSEPEDLPHRGLAVDVRSVLGRSASPRLVAVLERMLDPDPDRRPDRIAPLLEARGAFAAPDGAAEMGVDFGWDRRALRYALQEERHWLRAEVREKRARIRAARQEERAWRRSARHAAFRQRPALPWPLRLVFGLGLTAATVAVFVALRVAIPLLLVLLSLLFARRALRNGARAVRHAGHVAVDALGASRRWLGGRAALEGAAGAVSTQAGAAPSRIDAQPRARVAAADEEVDARDPEADADTDEDTATNRSRSAR